MEKRLGPFPSTPDGAPAPTLGERSGAPSGLRPSSFVICNTPVEVQFTSAGCLNYPCRTPAQIPTCQRAFQIGSSFVKPFEHFVVERQDRERRDTSCKFA